MENVTTLTIQSFCSTDMVLIYLSHGCYSTAVRAVSTHTVVIHNTDRQYPDNCDSEHGCYSIAVRIVSTHTVVIHSTAVTLQV